MNALPQLRLEKRETIPVVYVTGEINVLNEREFRTSLVEAAASNPPAVVVDLGGATYLSAGALGALTVTGARLTAAGKRLAVVCPERHVSRRLLKMLQFPYRVVASFENALEAGCDPAGPPAAELA